LESLRYVILALVLGGASVWASENFFWMMPPPGITPLEFGFTVLAYSVAAAVALSAVIWSGLGGMAGAFLGGAIMGYMSEGVIVGTIYESIPFQLVWTPLAWHGLITGGVVLGLGRAGLGPARMAVIWVLLGLGGSYWAQYWVTERVGVPGTALFAFYVLGLGLLVPLAQIVLDRVGSLPRPPVWMLLIAPAIAVLVWGTQTVAEMNPVRLVLPAILGVILWVMRRLGRGVAYLGPKVPAWQHLLFLIAPALVVVLAPLGWAQGWGSLESNWVVALPTCLVSVVWLGILIWRTAARPQTISDTV
jgi:hypothetical protein